MDSLEGIALLQHLFEVVVDKLLKIFGERRVFKLLQSFHFSSFVFQCIVHSCVQLLEEQVDFLVVIPVEVFVSDLFHNLPDQLPPNFLSLCRKLGKVKRVLPSPLGS